MLEDKILLAHGSGGKFTHDLIRQLFLPKFFNPSLEPLDDSARIINQEGSLAFTTDSYVVNPLFSLEEILGSWPSVGRSMTFLW